MLNRILVFVLLGPVLALAQATDPAGKLTNEAIIKRTLEGRLGGVIRENCTLSDQRGDGEEEVSSSTWKSHGAQSVMAVAATLAVSGGLRGEDRSCKPGSKFREAPAGVARASVEIGHLLEVWSVSKLRVVRPGALVHILAGFDVIDGARLRAQAEGRPGLQMAPQTATSARAIEEHPRKPGTVPQRARWLRAFPTHRYGGGAARRNARCRSAGDCAGCSR